MQSIRHEAKALSSWKEIAAYLGKGVRTVQRWEHELNLPVSRPKKAHKGFVLSSTDRLDRWVATNWVHLTSQKKFPSNTAGPEGVAASIRDFRRLRQANRELAYDLKQVMEELKGESQELFRTLSRSSETKSSTTEQADRSSKRKRS